MIKSYPNEEKLHQSGVERSFIACIMRFPELIIEAQASVGIDDIYTPSYHIIYESMLEMKKEFDLKKLKYVFTQELILRYVDALDDETKSVFDRSVGKYSYLTMMQNAPGVDLESFPEYIRIILETSSLIKAYRASFDLQDKILDPRKVANAQEIVNEAGLVFNEIRIPDLTSSIVKLGDCIDELRSEAKFNKSNKGRVGIWLSNFPRLMKVLNGFRRTQFIVLFARPKTGKSTLLLNFGLETAFQNIPTLYLDTEMTSSEQASRAISNWSGIREWDIMSGDYLDDESKVKEFDKYADKLKKAPFYYVAAKGCNTDKIIAYMREFVTKYVGYDVTPDGKKKTKPCLVIYDWLKVADSDSLNKVKEYQELGFIATSLNDARRELDVPLVAGAQANRFGNDSTVGVDSAMNAQNFLADSDRLLRFCTCLIWLRRLNFNELKTMEEFAQSNPDKAYNQMLHVVDQRGGPTCFEGIGLKFTGETLSYEEKDAVDLKKFASRGEDFVKKTRKEKLKKAGIVEDEQSDSATGDFAVPI